MGIVRLSLVNFRNSFRNYLSLILSMAFTILVLFNFQNIRYSGAFEVLGSRNGEYVAIIINVISFVLGCFMFFFIWYATNVFLTRRKKEMGVYMFMGLSNEKIGELYFLETTFTGLAALFLGLALGGLCSGLFQMILLAVSEVSVEIGFVPGVKPMLLTAEIYLAVYMIFVVKGYVSIVRSSVLNMILAAKQNEYVKSNIGFLVIKAVLGINVLGTGYYLAVKESSAGTMGNAFTAVVLVTAGVYLLFGGLIPFVFQSLADNKGFLYQRQRTLWVNSVIFRMKKNYRTYAMVCVLMLCSVTALATGFAMKGRYDSIIQFENTYTFQLLSSRDDLDQRAREAIESSGEITASSMIPVLSLPSSAVDSGRFVSARYGVLPFSRLKQAAEDTGMSFETEGLGDDEVIQVSHLYLMSLITDTQGREVEIGGKTYRQVEETVNPYLGYLQESMSFYAVSDREYERLLPMGQVMYTYNYRIGDMERFEEAKERVDGVMAGLAESENLGRVAVDPKNNELDWVKVTYSICIFMFLVFILASGSIMFMKLYNDGFEERERYGVMVKMGVDRESLRKSIMAELGVAYGVTFGVMAVSSLFSVGALGKMMYADLRMVNVVSVGVVMAVFGGFYWVSVKAYGRNVGVE